MAIAGAIKECVDSEAVDFLSDFNFLLLSVNGRIDGIYEINIWLHYGDYITTASRDSLS